MHSEQSALAHRMGPTLRNVSDFLHEKGYYGPVGIDVVEDGRRGQYIVDLNVRTASSSLLGSLRGHFVSRGMNYAGLLLVRFGMRRRGFGERMDGEMEAGRIITVGWFEQNANLSCARIVVGAEDGEHLANIIDAIDELSNLSQVKTLSYVEECASTRIVSRHEKGALTIYRVYYK